MRHATRVDNTWMPFAILAILALWILACRTAAAQQGQDAVYNPSGQVTNSPSFIDASVFVSITNPNICAVLYNILNGTLLGRQGYPATGAVIDARGISGSTALTCSPGTTPWNNGTITLTVPSTILLPATGGATPTPIIISSMWILPVNTHLIGEGDGIPSSGTTPGTTIQAASGFSGTMIQFGSSSACTPSVVCTGISIEKLTLDGQGQLGQTVSGVANGFSQDFSYVDHVTLYRILGTGLSVTGSANNSGPYSNITFDTGGSTSLPTTACAQIKGPTGTRGIHGLTCISESNDPLAAVLLDSSNNSIEDPGGQS
jgi:hypothetical protein